MTIRQTSSQPVWLFDLDDTLHHASMWIFPQIDRNMTAYIAEHLALSHHEANTLRIHYWRRYGATLHGLVRHHGIDSAHFLNASHRFDSLHHMVVFEHALHAVLRRLPGRKIIFSNGQQHYVDTVIDIMGIRPYFDAVCGIERQGLHPKPNLQAFYRLLRTFRLNPRRCILVEDSSANLLTAKKLRMKTVLVSRSLKRPAHVDVKIASILDLRRVAGHLLR